jgi:hypothetical protein
MIVFLKPPGPAKEQSDMGFMAYGYSALPYNLQRVWKHI